MTMIKFLLSILYKTYLLFILFQVLLNWWKLQAIYAECKYEMSECVKIAFPQLSQFILDVLKTSFMNLIELLKIMAMSVEQMAIWVKQRA